MFLPSTVFSFNRTTLRRSIIVPGGANNEYRGGPGGPDTGFCSPGGADYQYQDHQDHPGTDYWPPPGTIIERLRVSANPNTSYTSPSSPKAKERIAAGSRGLCL